MMSQLCHKGISPLPDSKRASAALFEWQMIEQVPSDDEREGGVEGGRGHKDSGGNDEDLERKKLYLLVARCIAFPFNAKYQIETTPPRAKLNRERFGTLCRTLQAVVEDFTKVSLTGFKGQITESYYRGPDREVPLYLTEVSSVWRVHIERFHCILIQRFP